MQEHMSGKAEQFLRVGDDESSLSSRSDRDQRAIKLACDLLVAGIAFERQVITLVRARSR